MSKGEGKKIAIRFNDKLIGAVTDNLAAFTVTGNELLHVDGVQIAGNYEVESVSAYPALSISFPLNIGSYSSTEYAAGVLRLVVL